MGSEASEPTVTEGGVHGTLTRVRVDTKLLQSRNLKNATSGKYYLTARSF